VSSPLAGFVPDLVKDRLAVGPPRQWSEIFPGTALVADVSGSSFIARGLRSRSGVDELNQVLDRVITGLVAAVAAHGGDVAGFTGDGLVAVWRGASLDAAVAAARAFQAPEGAPPPGAPIGVRIGVASGEVAVRSVGGEGGRWLFVAGGPAVVAATRAQARAPVGSLAVAGETEPARAGGPPPAGGRPRTPRTGPVPEDALAAYAFGDMAERLRASGEGFLSEVRTVTALFVRARDHELFARLARLQAFASLLLRTTGRYGCGLNRIMVDDEAVVALVVAGSPGHAHEDGPDRVLALAHDLRAGLGRESLARSGLGMGLATGLALCGTVGGSLRREYTVVGDAVNVASHLARRASAGSGPGLLCDEPTTRAAKRWRFGPALAVPVKGRRAPAEAREARARGPAEPPHPATFVVGRDAVLAGLESVLDAGGEVVLLEGEAGMGKSVVLGEIGRRMAARGWRVLRGQADPLAAGGPYHAWRPVFEDLWQLGEVPVGQRGAHLVEQLGPEAHLVGPALGIDLPGEAATGSVEERAARTRDALRARLAAAWEGGDLVVLLDDVHWFDSASWSLVTALVGVAGARVLGAARLPVSTWWAGSHGPAGSGLRRVGLDPLEPGEVAEVARCRLGTAAIEASLATLLAGRSGGNPYFLAEILTALEAAGALATAGASVGLGPDAEDAPVPSSIETALAGRLDAVGPERQMLLKVSSVVGPTTTVGTLAEILPVGRPRAELVADLEALGRAELLAPVPATVDDLTPVSFRHALVRDCAYQLLTRRQRASLHGAVARHLSQADPPARPGVLGHHWLQGGEAERAIPLLQAATAEDLAFGMLREAVGHATQALRAAGLDLGTRGAGAGGSLEEEMAAVARRLGGRRPRALLELAPLSSQDVLRQIALAFETLPAAFQCGDLELFALLSARILRLTLDHGSSPFTPGVHAMYSIVLRSLGADAELAYEFSDLALSMVGTEPGPLSAPVKFIHAWFHNHWARPVATGVPLALAASQDGFATGDELYGCYGLGAAVTLAAASGEHLASVVERGQAYAERIGARSANALFHARLEAQVAKALAGTTPSLASLSDPWCDEGELAAMVDSDNANQAGCYHVAKLRLAYLEGDRAEARRCLERAEALEVAFAGQVAQIDLVTFRALLDAAEGGGATPAGGDLGRLEGWARTCPDNFAARARLVAAERAARAGDPGAGRLFATATEAAVAAGAPLWAGLAAERRGRWEEATGGDPAPHLDAAADHYRAWGAHRLVEGLASRRTAGPRRC